MSSPSAGQYPHAESAPLVAADAQPFTPANLFGMLLTLDLCLLAQPYGSFLYPKPKTRIGRAVFMFWRLNPIAAATEAMSLTIVLLFVLISSRRKPKPGPWFQHGIAAILILRSEANWKKTCGSEQQSEFEMTRLIPNEEQPQAVLVPSPAGVRLRGQGLEAHYQPPQGTVHEPDGQTSVDSLQTHLSMGSSRSLSFIIDFVSVLAVIVTIIKICVISIPWHIKVVLWFGVASFLSCQVLVMLSRCMQPDQLDMVELLRLTEFWDSNYRRQAIILSWFIVVIPSIVYISYSACFPIRILTTEIYLSTVLILFYLAMRDVTGRDTEMLRWVKRRYVKGSQPRPSEQQTDTEYGHAADGAATERRDNSETAKVQAMSRIGDWVIRILIGNLMGFLPDKYNPIGLVSIWLFGRAAHDVANFVFVFIITSFVLLAPMQSTRKNSLWAIDLFLNIILSQYVLACMMISYDAEHTLKPDWLEWLG